MKIIPKNQAGRVLGQVSLAELLPPSLASDPVLPLIAKAVEAELRRVLALYDGTLLWARLEKLTEPVLSHLAVMLHADLWDETWSLKTKRDFLRAQFYLHRIKGTAHAVELAVSLVYSDTAQAGTSQPAQSGQVKQQGGIQVKEWFNYGGQRGHFMLDVPVLPGGLNAGQIAKIELMVECFKRKSQHLGNLRFFLESSGQTFLGGAALADEVITVNQYQPKEITAPKQPQNIAGAFDLVEDIEIGAKPQNP